MTCPHCRHKITLEQILERLTDEEVKKLWAMRCGRKQTPHAGPGRPKKNPETERNTE